MYFVSHTNELLVAVDFVFRDAEDAVRDRDGYDYDGYSLRVEWPHGEKGSAPSRGRGGGGGGGYGGSYRGGRFRGGGGYVRGRPPSGPPPGARRSDYRILVTGMTTLCDFEYLSVC